MVGEEDMEATVEAVGEEDMEATVEAVEYPVAGVVENTK